MALTQMSIYVYTSSKTSRHWACTPKYCHAHDGRGVAPYLSCRTWTETTYQREKEGGGKEWRGEGKLGRGKERRHGWSEYKGERRKDREGGGKGYVAGGVQERERWGRKARDGEEGSWGWVRG